MSAARFSSASSIAAHFDDLPGCAITDLCPAVAPRPSRTAPRSISETTISAASASDRSRLISARTRRKNSAMRWKIASTRALPVFHTPSRKPTPNSSAIASSSACSRVS